ncbi:MAG: ribonuclease HIII [Candidatus Cloacimonadaceae bacterium]|nr:ribonuclease HIII [Candidatus Cloacimonadaceae bacterium]
MHKALEEYLAHLIPELHTSGIIIRNEKALDYGTQLLLQCGEEKNTVNLYYSEKKGISVVLGGSKTNQLYNTLQNLMQPSVAKQLSSVDFHHWNSWIGSDECGKGDYLGGLVVCGFAVQRNELQSLKKLGVTDSKKLKDERLIQMALEIYKLYPKRISCIVLKPLKYNELYASLKAQGKNLNDLLAWQHSAVIKELIQRDASVEGALVDQFSRSMKVKHGLEKQSVTVPIVERPKAESDIAVAAASILARYQFLQLHQSLARYYKTAIPLGAGANVNKAARDFIGIYGSERLKEIAKLHFVSTKKVLGL